MATSSCASAPTTIGIACYASAGVVRVSAEDEAAFNAGQSEAYQWLRHQG